MLAHIAAPYVKIRVSGGWVNTQSLDGINQGTRYYIRLPRFSSCCKICRIQAPELWDWGTNLAFPKLRSTLNFSIGLTQRFTNFVHLLHHQKVVSQHFLTFCLSCPMFWREETTPWSINDINLLLSSYLSRSVNSLDQWVKGSQYLGEKSSSTCWYPKQKSLNLKDINVLTTAAGGSSYN